MSTARQKRTVAVVLLIVTAVLWVLAALFKWSVTPFFHAFLIKRIGTIPVPGFMFVAPLLAAVIGIVDCRRSQSRGAGVAVIVAGGLFLMLFLGGKTAMALYIDGRLASARCLGNAKNPNDRPLKMKPLPFPVQLGSMNTGYRPADALIDELRISSVRRYDEAFVPVKRLDKDSTTLTLFHFDGNLDAEAPAGCHAVAGPVQ